VGSTDSAGDLVEHPNLRRARFEALARDELIEPLRRFLTRRADAATVDDVLSETLLVCWRRFDDLPETAALPWAYGVARHCLANADRSTLTRSGGRPSAGENSNQAPGNGESPRT